MNTNPKLIRKLTVALGAVLLLGQTGPLRAASVVLTYTNRTLDAWMTPTCWQPNTNWATGTYRTNLINNDLRLNIGATANAAVTVTYNATMGTTTIVETNAGDRCLAISSGQATAAGTLNLTGGTLRCVPKVGVVAVFLGGTTTTTTTNNLNLNGGTLDYSGGELGITYRGTSPTWNRVTVNSGTLIADTIDFGAFGDPAVSGRGDLNLNGGTTIVRTIKAGGVAAKTDNVVATVNLNGGTLQAATNSTTLIDGAFAAIAGGSTATFTVNLSNNLATTFNIPTNLTTSVTALIQGPGGFTKTGPGALNLYGQNNFIGPMVVNQGGLGLELPVASSLLTMNANTLLRVNPNSSFWALSSLALTNTMLEYAYGTFNGYTNGVLYITNLSLTGNITVNLTGNSFPVTNITLLSYGSKSGGGAFVLGSLPSGAAAQLVDDGANLILEITAASVQTLTWSGGDGIWQTNGGLDWNGNSAMYLQYGSGFGDIVIFDDTSGGTVTLGSQVNPSSTSVNVTNSFYTFNGTGSIGGTNGIAFNGLGTLTINNSNNFSGPVTLNGGSGTTGGTLFVNHPNALGDTNGTTTVNGPANTLELGTPGGPAVGVTNETLIINGTGVGGAKGALRGGATSGGTNIWAGPVIIASAGSRIGAEDNGNLTVSGNITDNGLGYSIVLRPGANATLTLSGVSNNWNGASSLFGSGSGSLIQLGANNGISSNAPMTIGSCTLDLNGFNQAAPALGLATGGPGPQILTDSGAAATFTLNAATASSSFPGDVTGNLAFVKTGTNTFTMNGVNLTYTGATAVNQGQLIISTANPLSTSITVAGGATLGGKFTTTGSLALNANSTLNVDPSTPASIVTTTLMAASAPVNVTFASAPAVGVPVLIVSTTGGITGPAANFQAIGVRSGTFYTANSGNDLMFVANPVPTITWRGNDPVNPSFWDITSTMNWLNGISPDIFFTGDDVLFDDSATSFAVVIPGASVAPGSVTFSNTANAYSLSGGAMNGTFSLVKNGTNALTLNAANNYSGSTIINGGILFFAADNRLGTAPATPTSSNIVLNTGELMMTAQTQILNSNRNIYVTAAGGTLGNSSGANYTPSLIEGPGQLKLDCTVAGANFLMNQQSTFAGGMLLTGNSNAYVYPIVSSVGTPGNLGSGPWGTGPVIFNGPGTRSTTGGATTVANPITFAADVSFQTVGSEKTLTFSGPITLSGGDRTLNVAIGTTVASASLVMNGPIGQTSSGLGLVKSGGGQMILAGTNTYTGLTIVNNGTLVVAATSAVTNSPGIIVNSPGHLDVSAAPFNLLANQSLQGNGTITGDTTASGSLSPGGAGAIGTLTFNNSLTLAGNVFVEINKALSQSNDVINVGSTLSNAGNGTLTVTNLGSTPLAVGDYFQLFNQPLANGSALTIVGPMGVTFTNNLAADGSITVLTAPPTAPPVLNYTLVGGNQLQFSWTGGGILQSQTNDLRTGLNSNWSDYPGGSTSPVTVTPDPANAGEFFRVKQ